MIVVDLNVLIYAVDERSSRHEVAREWLDRSVASSRTVGIPTAVAVGFVRLTTSPRVMSRPLDVATSVGVVNQWYRRSNVSAPGPTVRHFDIVEQLLASHGTGGNLVADAHLAALAVEHGAELYSFDHDFGRFGGVRWLVPGPTT